MPTLLASQLRRPLRARAILAGVAVAALIAVLAVSQAPARAAAPGALIFEKVGNPPCWAFLIISDPGHWTGDYNPSLVNAGWRDLNCGAPISVTAGPFQPTP